MWSLHFYCLFLTTDRGQAYSFAHLCLWMIAVCAKLSVLQRVSLSFLRLLVAKKVYPITKVLSYPQMSTASSSTAPTTAVLAMKLVWDSPSDAELVYDTVLVDDEICL